MTQLRNQQAGLGKQFIPLVYESWTAAGLDEGPLERLEELSLARALEGDFEPDELSWILGRRLQRLAGIAATFTNDRIGAVHDLA